MSNPAPLLHDETAPASALVPAVVRAAAVLDTLARLRQPMSMARLSAELGLPRSSMHGLCNTLVALGYLRRANDGQLAIGPRVMGLAEAFVASTDVAREFDALWQSLAQPPDETVLLSVLDGADVLYLATRNGARPLGLAFSAGMRLPAHIAATGKAMLAFSSAAAVRQLLGEGPLTRITERGAPHLQALLAELAETRQRGYSVDDEGVRLGVYCLAAPVLDAAGQPMASVGVCLNKAVLDAAAIDGQRQWLVRTAQVLTQRLGGGPSPALPAWQAVSDQRTAAASKTPSRQHAARP